MIKNGRKKITAVGIGWKLVCSYLAGAVLTGMAVRRGHSAERRQTDLSGKCRESNLYGMLALFPDTVLFRYRCKERKLDMTSNAGDSINRPLLIHFLEKYEETPPGRGEEISFEFHMNDVAETWCWCICRLRAEYREEEEEEAGVPEFLIGKLDDISEQKAREESLVIQSTRDGLTGVYNKTAFEYIVAQELKKNRACWLYMIDIDNFKEVNDTFGHRAGDKILVALGDSLREIFKTPDLIGRVGGDEFVVYTENENSAVQGETLLKTVPLYAAEAGYSVSVSIGAAAGDGTTEKQYEALFSQADQALYQAKEQGKNRIVFYALGR